MNMRHLWTQRRIRRYIYLACCTRMLFSDDSILGYNRIFHEKVRVANIIFFYLILLFLKLDEKGSSTKTICWINWISFPYSHKISREKNEKKKKFLANVFVDSPPPLSSFRAFYRFVWNVIYSSVGLQCEQSNQESKKTKDWKKKCPPANI